MARARNIKPAFFENEELVECSFAARLCFIGLWTLADREGRLEDRPRRIKMSLFPGDDVQVNDLLDELVRMGMILRYEAKGFAVISIPKFTKHQRPHQNESASDLPSPDEAGDANAFDHGEKGGEPPQQPLRSESLSLNEECGSPHPEGAQGASEGGDDEADSGQELAPADPDPVKPAAGSKPFERWWAAYPKKVKKRNARDVWKRKCLDGHADFLIADVEHRHASDRKWIEGHYIPDPERYLRDERWNDEIEPPRSGQQASEQVADSWLAERQAQARVVGEQ